MYRTDNKVTEEEKEYLFELIKPKLEDELAYAEKRRKESKEKITFSAEYPCGHVTGFSPIYPCRYKVMFPLEGGEPIVMVHNREWGLKDSYLINKVRVEFCRAVVIGRYIKGFWFVEYLRGNRPKEVGK